MFRTRCDHDLIEQFSDFTLVTTNSLSLRIMTNSFVKQAVLLLSVAAAYAADQEEWEAPWFCHGINCPRYKDVKNMTIDRETVEIRVYESAMWSSTVIANTEFGIELVLFCLRCFCPTNSL